MEGEGGGEEKEERGGEGGGEENGREREGRRGEGKGREGKGWKGRTSPLQILDPPLVVEDRPIMSVKYCLPVPVFHF